MKVTIEIEVDEGWIDFAIHSSDIFKRRCCGYWLYGVDRNDNGWLCYVDDEGVPPPASAVPAAITAWEAGEVLPTGFYRLDRQAAIEAFKQGVLWHGAEWYEKGDADSYDYVIQMALLGKIVYG